MRRLAAIIAACGILLVGPALAGPAGGSVVAHATLVTSEPGAGEVVPTSPATLTLTFAEPFEPAYSNVDVLDGSGATVIARAGVQDPGDPRIMTVALPPLADGVYTVDWRTVSAADGHATSGFYTFGVGDVAPPTAGTAGGGGDLHAGHGAGLILLETESRALADLGFMLAFGLAISSVFVLRAWPVVPAIAWALALGAIGSVTLAAVGALSSSSPSVAYVLGTRTGVLLVARVAVAVAGIVAIRLATRARHPRTGVIAGGLAGIAGIACIVAAGHASAFASPVPILAALIHVCAAAVWIGGLAVVAWVAVARPPAPLEDLRHIVPRFSALALICVALVAATGLYADWLLTGAPIRFDTPYAIALLVKILLVATAFAIGALNYLDGGRGARRFGGFQARVIVEAGLAVAILIATGNLASGSPPGLSAPVTIQSAFSSATAADATLELLPGRPGPTRFIVTAPGHPGGVDLVLARLDAGSGTSRIVMRPALGSGAASGEHTFVSDGGQLPARSRWDVTAVVHDAAGVETGRTRFTFAMDATGVAEGRASPPLDVALLVAITLLGGALLLGIFTVAGGVLPRVEPTTGRLASVLGTAVAGALGIAILLAGRI